MEYAVYKGDEFIMIGTIYEIANEFGIKIESAKYYLTDAYKRRIKRRGSKNYRLLVPMEETYSSDGTIQRGAESNE